MYLDSKDKEYYAEIRRYNSVLKEFPENSHVLRERANCRFWHADWKRAANDFELLLQKNPDDAVLWVMMGQACVHGRLPRQAVTACSRAIELDPDFDLPYMHRAWAYRQLKQWDASIADYTKAMELDRKRKGSMHSTLYRGELYMEMGEYEKAASDFTLAISGSRFWYRLYAWRGIAYTKMKNYEKVIENANAFMDLDGELNEYLLKQRSYAYKKLGQKDKAEADLALIKRLNEELKRERDANQKKYAKQFAKEEREHEREIKKRKKQF
jgi:tetratricopeptide (TPR) repeat protein